MRIAYGVESSLEGPRVHPTSRDASSDNSHDLREQLFTRDVENVYNNNGRDGDDNNGDERPGNVWSRSGCLDDKKGDDDDNEDDCLSCISVWELTQHCLR